MQSMTSTYFARESTSSNSALPRRSTSLYTKDSAAPGAAHPAAGSLETASYRHLVAPGDGAPVRPMEFVAHRDDEEAGGRS
jgi:hypothetical protein